ncbi:MAG: PAS domain S-box protein, partial [Gammaproteobacteria bacterium]
MNKKKDNSKTISGIRQRAIQRVSLSDTDIERMTREEIRELVHNLQTYQIELELQNEELRETQHALSLSRNRYAQLYDDAPIGFVTMNDKGIVLQANKRAADLLSCDRAKLAGSKLATFFSEPDQDGYYLFFKGLLVCPEKQVIELKIINGLGTKTYVEIQACVIHLSDDGYQCLMSICDISERKRAETTIQALNHELQRKVGKQTKELISINLELRNKISELAKSRQDIMAKEAKLTSIFNAAVEGIITIDALGIIQTVNNAVTAIFGYRPEELLGRNISMLTSLDSAHDAFLKKYHATRRSDFIGSVREVQGVRKNGSSVPIDLSVAEFTINGAVYFTGILRDATLRKEKEQKEKEHLAELAHATRVGLMGEMASGIAHQVNQPLTAIATYSRTCLNMIELPQCDLPKIKEVLRKIHDQAIKAGQIVHRMKDYVKLQKIHPVKTNINESIKVAVALCQAECSQSTIECR